jgi:hypothetical protein
VFEWYIGSVRERKQILHANEQEWEWGLDCIFPSVVEVPQTVVDRLARYYLFYSCHDSPAGIGLAISDSLRGPWRKYKGNPVMTRTCCRGYAHGHISSPHVLFDTALNHFVMYYHGLDEWESQGAIQSTGRAVSEDGLEWIKDEQPCLDASDTNSWNSGELSYARATKFQSGVYHMVYMARDRNRSAPVLGYACSADGKEWKKATRPLMVGGNGLQPYISSGQIVEISSLSYLLFCDEREDATNTTIKICKIDLDSLTTSTPITVLAPRKWPRWDRVRNHDPFLLYSDSVWYLFYAAGKRSQSVGIGVTPMSQLEELLLQRGPRESL